MYQKIKAKFKANPTIFYACSIVASWAGVGSLMNFRTLAINNGAAAAIIWAVFNSLACIFFGLFAEYIPTVRRIMQSKVMFYFIGFLTVFQTWTQMSGITQGLRWIAETDNDLWERIQRREPNAYLVLLYWDSEMFRRTTRKRGELEEESEKKDYKALCKDLLFLHPERYTIAKDTLSHIEHWRGLFIKTYGIAEQKHYKTMYEGLLYGDPKMRILRILWTTIYNDHNARIKEEQNHGKH